MEGAMMQKSKAAFRAMREECGLSQQDVADEAGVRVLSVKRWENPAEPNQPPDDVWAFLLACRDELLATAKAMADSVRGLPDGPVTLTYYRDQRQLGEVQLDFGNDRPVGYANAITRRAAALLEVAGREVNYTYPG